MNPHDPVNLMPKTVTAPNGLTTTLDYHPAAADLRLKEIKHTLTGNIALSKHVYGYKPAGNIKSWAQTLGTNAAKTWAIAYDKADQLEAATQTQGTTVTAQQAFRFDRIGNITSKQDGSEVSGQQTPTIHRRGISRRLRGHVRYIPAHHQHHQVRPHRAHALHPPIQAGGFGGL